MLALNNIYDFGAIIRGRRDELGLSQKALAEKASTSYEWISRFESGRIEHPDLSVILRVMKALDIAIMGDPGRKYVPDEDFSDFENDFTDAQSNPTVGRVP